MYHPKKDFLTQRELTELSKLELFKEEKISLLDKVVAQLHLQIKF